MAGAPFIECVPPGCSADRIRRRHGRPLWGIFPHTPRRHPSAAERRYRTLPAAAPERGRSSPSGHSAWRWTRDSCATLPMIGIGALAMPKKSKVTPARRSIRVTVTPVAGREANRACIQARGRWRSCPSLLRSRSSGWHFRGEFGHRFTANGVTRSCVPAHSPYCPRACSRPDHPLASASMN
jgi:hypothetical protein